METKRETLRKAIERLGSTDGRNVAALCKASMSVIQAFEDFEASEPKLRPQAFIDAGVSAAEGRQALKELEVINFEKGEPAGAVAAPTPEARFTESVVNALEDEIRTFEGASFKAMQRAKYIDKLILALRDGLSISIEQALEEMNIAKDHLEGISATMNRHFD